MLILIITGRLGGGLRWQTTSLSGREHEFLVSSIVGTELSFFAREHIDADDVIPCCLYLMNNVRWNIIIFHSGYFKYKVNKMLWKRIFGRGWTKRT